jgi:hypothetical protein
MMLEEMLAIGTSIILAVLFCVLYKIISKKSVSGWVWIFPISFPIGSVFMYFFTDSDSYFIMLKDELLWAFIISMIVVNIRFLIFGSKSGIQRGKTFVSDFKNEWNNNIKPVFKKNKKEENDKDGNDK